MKLVLDTTTALKQQLQKAHEQQLCIHMSLCSFIILLKLTYLLGQDESFSTVIQKQREKKGMDVRRAFFTGNNWGEGRRTATPCSGLAESTR